ncbi:hypothetical protein [Paenibacillus roseipurpureus]|uniref:Uncharacterized protein n=1 Tax=Paenibacillus roseopurpureus TaxID=2918901 RepID=A0AA96RIM3_9BACL|nr:hypothetical protein [Paenibacillus sp. MBLB1832]WNR42965.1 hypothetical protein MJB10_17810 [Paenibacillus sp. MBLB1832]
MSKFVLAETITVEQRWSPPSWALMERQLFDTLNRAAIEYVQRYTREDGTLIWREDWPGMDGSDDPYEAFMNLSLLYALGGSEEVLRLSRLMFEAVTWQWTQYGQIHEEFDAYYDWMHHGEGSLYFYFQGLSDPHALKNRQRAVRFANLYTGRNAEVGNYDQELELIRSPITGSKGPRFEMTEEDWCTHRGVLDNYLAPFEDIPGVEFASGQCPWSNDEVYAEIIKRMNERKAKGDVPLNLNATGLVTNAYLYTGDEHYARWVLDYLQAWEERTQQNGGITPDNIGLTGKIGEYNDGKWWGGYYGWRWPHGFMTIIEPILNASMNAVLLTGDKQKLDLARQQLDRNWELGCEIEGRWHTPHKHFDAGWTDYRVPRPTYPVFLWTISMAEEDAARVDRIPYNEIYSNIEIPIISGGNRKTGKDTKHYIANTIPWYLFMRGRNTGYPEQILQQNLELIAKQLEKMRSPKGDPFSWDWNHPNSIHQWQEYCPLYYEGLLQMTLGAPMHISHGGLQHARVRYYDSIVRRPGLPQDVAALVDALSDDNMTLTVINVSEFESREIIIQAGSFGEHQFTGYEMYNAQGDLCGQGVLDSKWLHVKLASGSGAKLKLSMRRYVNTPSYETPWTGEYRKSDPTGVLRGRTN